MKTRGSLVKRYCESKSSDGVRNRDLHGNVEGERCERDMKEIYKKTSFVSFLGGVGATVLGVFYYLYFYKSFSENGLILMEIAITAVALLGAGIYFKGVHNKLNVDERTNEESQFNGEALRELNIQWVPSPFPKMYNVDEDGNPLFKIEPCKQHPFMRKLTFFSPFANGFIIPVTYDILDMENHVLASFTSWTNGNRYELTLFNVQGEVIGSFEQKLTESKMKNKGTLSHADGSVWRKLEAKNMAGDIDVQNREGILTASYRFGMFPYALKPAFASTAHHDHVRIGDQITREEKLAYAMIFFFWLRK